MCELAMQFVTEHVVSAYVNQQCSMLVELLLRRLMELMRCKELSALKRRRLLCRLDVQYELSL